MTQAEVRPRAAIYARLSDEDKNKLNHNDPSESIKNQISLAKEFINENGWLLTRIYTDDDWSGLDRTRPEFNRLLKDCEHGLIDVVICKDMSRFTRDKIITEEYLETKFLEWKIRFIGLTDGSDTADRANKKSREINALVNQWYAEDISNKVRAAFKARRRQGAFIGSFPPFGFMKSDQSKGVLIIDPEAAQLVKKIFNLYLAGNGSQVIAHILNQEKIPNPTAYKEAKNPKYKNAFKKSSSSFWNKTSVKRILRNEAYIGNMVQHKSEKLHFKTKKRANLPREEWEIVEGTHQAIIERDNFNKVQKMLNSKVRSGSSGIPHMLAGLVVCKDCGSTLVRTSRDKYSYLTCSLNRTHPHSCSRHSIRLDLLISIIQKRIKNLLTQILGSKDILIQDLIKRESFTAEINLLNSQIDNINQQINHTMKALKELYFDKSQSKIDAAAFEKVRETLITENTSLEAKLRGLNFNLAAAVQQENRYNYWCAVLKRYDEFSELSRDLVTRLINLVEIGEIEDYSREIVIHYNFKFSV